ncbi:MAG: hypothetical protein IAB19_01010 [Proteobacteria bacterium]|uniref:MoaB/Mog domain-containing protein n=1 Tax=Candidatus Avisuccinivibrio stercorigallinarum TaxID=2840704 RepID=A0A9D9D9Q2_9GAMM|nr:hypothetical protein [Candidatus Avisuccinivibrio stercorigallinarum]
MQFEIVSTGDEVITGFITDTNVSYLAQELLSLGIQARYRHTVGDSLEDIVKLLAARSREADVILVNGGLGPTTDDVTTEAAAKAAGAGLVLNELWLERLKKWHQERGRVMPENNIKQAMLPEGAVMIDNPRGTACGFYLKINKALCFFTPGVPSEFKGMFQDFIKPYLMQQVLGQVSTKVKRFFTFGVSESKIGQTLKAEHFAPSIVIGYRAAYPLLEIKVIEHGADAAKESAAVAVVREKLAPYLICEDDFDLGRRIDELTEHAPVVLFDNATSGQIAVDLASDINLQSAFISVHRLSSAMTRELTELNCRYFYQVMRTEDGSALEYKLSDLNSMQVWHYRYKLNVTLKDKKRAAAALVGEALLYQILSGRPLLRPDDAEIEVLAEGERA